MIVRRIRAVEPPKDRTGHEENRAGVEHSKHCDPDADSAEIETVRNGDQNDQECGLIRLRRIFPRSPRP